MQFIQFLLAGLTLSLICAELGFGSNSNSCNNYWSYQRNLDETFGRIVIPHPNYDQNIVNLELSLAAKLTSVRFTLAAH